MDGVLSLGGGCGWSRDMAGLSRWGEGPNWAQRGWPSAGGQPSASTRDVPESISNFPGGGADTESIPEVAKVPVGARTGVSPPPSGPPLPRRNLPNDPRSIRARATLLPRSRLNSILLITKRPLVGDAGSGVPGGLLPRWMPANFCSVSR